MKKKRPSYSDEVYNPITNIEDLYQDKSNTTQYDTLVFIGRFQPLHLGHTRVIDIALKKSKKVIILVGSSNRPRRPRNPWSFEERKQMIKNHYYNTVPDDKLIILPLDDFTYRDNLWIERVQELVNENTEKYEKIGLIGCSKDHTSYYLKLFPQWGNINVRFLNPLNSTDLRKIIFSNETVTEKINKLKIFVSPLVLTFVDNFIKNYDAYLYVKEYYDFCTQYYEKRQKNSLYPVQDLTADALVIKAGHVLLITRKHQPAKGVLAMAGGYVNPDESMLDAAIRELIEETNISYKNNEGKYIPYKHHQLKNFVMKTGIFDDPNRSERGRIVTQVAVIRLPNDLNGLPQVNGGDDAASAKWIPFSEITTYNMFEDHADIIFKMLDSGD